MHIRLEEEKDFRTVENLTREAFWNKYRPGCTEHYVLHRFRSRADFIKELDYVIEQDGQIVAHITYCTAMLTPDSGPQREVITFGPVSVLPAMQGMGLGTKLITYTLEKAAQMGYGAVAITGNPQYYHRFGFKSGAAHGVYYAPAPRSEAAPFFMVKELACGYLNGFCGTYQDPEGYQTNDEEVQEFDAAFPAKAKKVLPGQLPTE